jgi:hypothetical protein
MVSECVTPNLLVHSYSMQLRNKIYCISTAFQQCFYIFKHTSVSVTASLAAHLQRLCYYNGRGFAGGLSPVMSCNLFLSEGYSNIKMSKLNPIKPSNSSHWKMFNFLVYI